MEEEEKKNDDLVRAMSVVNRRQKQNLLSEILAYILQNAALEKEDLLWLNKMFRNVKKRDFPFITKEEKETLEEYFKNYKDSKGLAQETLYERILLQNLKSINSKSDDLLNLIKDYIQEISSYYKKQANDKIKDLDKNIEQNLNKSREMLGEQAEKSNAKKYFDYAEKNRKAARRLFWGSVSIMAIVAGGATYLLWNIENIDIIKLWLRIPLGFLILLPSFFMMRESKKLKDKEFQYTDMAYRITTSEPYINGLNLPPEEKAKLKATLVKDFFGRPIECRDDGGLPPVDNICEVIRTCIESCK